MCVSHMQEAVHQTSPVHIIPTVALASEGRAHEGAQKRAHEGAQGLTLDVPQPRRSNMRDSSTQPLNHMHVQHCGNVTTTLHGTTPAGK